MARSFTGTDKVQAATDPTIPTALSVCVWTKGVPLTGAPYFYWNTAAVNVGASGTTILQLKRKYSTTASDWRVTAANNGLTFAQWNHVVWTHDGTLAAPLCYCNGVSKTVTVTTTPVGTVTLGAGPFTIGNQTAGAAPWGASLAYVSVYDVVLGPGEVLEHMLTGQVQGQQSVRAYPLDASNPAVDRSRAGNLGIVTGTTLQDDPFQVRKPIPRRRMIFVPPAAAGHTPFYPIVAVTPGVPYYLEV